MDSGRDLCWLPWCVRPSVGVIAIIVCIAVAVLLADVPTAWRWGVFSAGRVGWHPPLLVVPHAALKQAWVRRVCWFHRGRFEPGVLCHHPHRVFGLFLQQGRLQWLEEWGRVQPGVARRRRRRWGGRRGWYGSKPSQTGARFTWMAEVLRGRPAGVPACWGGSWYRHASRCERVVWEVAEGMVSGCLQGKGLVETVSGEVPIIGGSEFKPIRGHTLLRRQVPAAVRARAGGWVFVLLAHTQSLTAIEATLRQGAHVLLREVALGEAAPWQQLLTLCRGGGEAIRVGRSVEPRQEGGGGDEKRVWEVEEKKKVLFPAQTSNYLSNISQPLTPFDCSMQKQSNNCIYSKIKRTWALGIFQRRQWSGLTIHSEQMRGTQKHRSFTVVSFCNFSFYIYKLLTCRNCHGNL